MTTAKSAWKVLPGTTLRRLRSTPSYFFLIWRWGSWVYAFVWIEITGGPYWLAHRHLSSLMPLGTALLVFTFVHTLLLTLYAPVFQFFLPRLPGRKRLRRAARRGQDTAEGTSTSNEALAPFPPLIPIRPSWDTVLYGADVILCGLITYFSGYFGDPSFGVGSPFYRYGISSAMAVALTYRYRGGLIAAFVYVLFTLLGAFVPQPGMVPFVPKAADLVAPFLDTPIIVIISAYLATLLTSYARNKRELQNDIRRQKAMRRVSETIVREAVDRERLMQRSAEQIRQGGHFHRLILVSVHPSDNEEEGRPTAGVIDTWVTAELPDVAWPYSSTLFVDDVIRTGEKIVFFDPLSSISDRGYGLARLYLPICKDGRVLLVLGAESRRAVPFDSKQEDFLTVEGAQLLVALENIRLAERTIQLTAVAERGRIARDLHDGVAQLIYMLSLQAETCAAQAQRIAEASEEDAELLVPLTQRLDRLVTLSKQALWETRNSMYNLKPLMSDSVSLDQMLTHQLREFEAISGLTTSLEIEGSEEQPIAENSQAISHEHSLQQSRRYARVTLALFRIVQEALTNAYKHAHASHIHVYIRHSHDCVEVEVRDDGRGCHCDPYEQRSSHNEADGRVYSGRGLWGMRERAEELGGTLQFISPATGGVCVRTRIPI